MPKTTIDALARAVASMIREDSKPTGPTRLARTWVGGELPGGRKGVGVWDGGRERSTVLDIPDRHAEGIARAAAARNGQKSALWFTPGAGNDVLHVLKTTMPSKDVESRLKRRGVSYMTLLQGDGGKTEIHVVDQGGELASGVRAFAAETGAEYEPQPGTAGYAELATKLARVREEGGRKVYTHDADNPSYLLARLGTTVVAFEPKHNGTQWVWQPASDPAARYFVQTHYPNYRTEPGDESLPDAKTAAGSELTKEHRVLTGIDEHDGSIDWRSDETTPEDFYAA